LQLRSVLSKRFCFASKSEACDIHINEIERNAPGTRDVIVCSCNVLTDHDVRSAAKTDNSAKSARAVYGCLGCSAQCGRCARTIRKILKDALNQVCGESCSCSRCST
jgi:bacterioferritin-associated ferredoxin